MSTFKERAKKYAPWIGYVAFYLVCLVVFLVWTFPYDRLKERIVATFNSQQKSTTSPQELQIDELDSSWLTGLKATGVRLVTPSTDPQKPPAVLKIDEARARVSLFGLLFGSRDVSFRLDAFDGTVKGTFEDSGKDRAVDVQFEGVDMSKIESIAAQVGFPLEGRLSGTLKLQLPEGKASKANGSIALEIRDMFAGTAKELPIKTPMGPFTLPRLKVGSLTINGDAKDGVLKVSKVAASGGDVDLNGDGRVQLRENTNDAQLDVNLKFKINDAYKTKNDVTKLLFGAPGSKEKPMLEMNPQMAKAKTPDGFYGMQVRGTLGRPDVVPSGGGAVTVPSFGGGSFK